MAQWTHISISPGSGAKNFQRLPFFKYYHKLEWESKFILRLDAAKTTDDIKKFFKQNCSELNFQQKNQ